MTPYEDAVVRLSTGYYNSGIKSVGNPGGFAGDGHETNFPAALADVGLIVSTLATAAAMIPAAAPNAAAAQAAADDAREWYNATKAQADFFKPVSAAELWAGLNNTKFLSALGLFAASESIPQPFGSTITLDGNAGLCRHWTMTGNATLATPVNFKKGQSGRWRITMGGVGGFLLATSTVFRFPLGLEDLSGAPGAVDVISYYCHAPDDIECVTVRSFA